MTQHVNMQNVLNRVQSGQTQVKQQPAPMTQQGQSFEQILQKIKEKDIVVSKHASERINQRALNVTEKEWDQISQAMDKAERKGIKDAVIIMGERMMIANVPNRTVITASHITQLKDQIITNINGAIII